VLPGSSRADGGFGSTGGHDGERTELVSRGVLTDGRPGDIA
jgi:hypothetical protein